MIDTAMTLNAMHPDVLIVRHPDAGAVKLLSEKVNASVINAGDDIPSETYLQWLKDIPAFAPVLESIGKKRICCIYYKTKDPE